MAVAREQAFASVDDYIASFPAAAQEKLQLLRKTILEAAPGVVEKISYDMPGYELGASNLVYFAGYKKHIGLYGAGGAVELYPDELTPRVTGRGTLRFELKDALPVELITRIVKLRVEQNRESAAEASGKKTNR